jgi:hypothetical protein
MAATDKKAPDWELIERDYRAGVLSIREVAKTHGISDKAVRNKAKERGWERDLSEKIAEKVRTELVRTQSAPADPKTEREIIETAAATVVKVVRSHRKRIGHQTALVDLLTEQLMEAAMNRDDIEVEINTETMADQSGQRRTMMMRAVSLQSHSTIAVNLSNALKTLVGLERQAFNIKEEPETASNPLADLMAQLAGKTLKPVAFPEDDD